MNELIGPVQALPANARQIGQLPFQNHAVQSLVVDDPKEYYLRAIRKASDATPSQHIMAIITKGKAGGTWGKSVGDKTFSRGMCFDLQHVKRGHYRPKAVSDARPPAATARVTLTSAELDLVAQMFALGGRSAVLKVLRKLRTRVSVKTLQAISDAIREELSKSGRGQGIPIGQITSGLPRRPDQAANALSAINSSANGSANLDVHGFLEDVYAIAAHDLQTATDRVFDTIDRLLCNERADICDEILTRVDVSRLPSAILRSFLTITGPAKARLASRPAFFAKAFAEVTRQRGADMAQRLLGRLA